jgi:CRISPR-associated protein Cas2
MKKFIVIAYDVEDDRRRRQVAKLLEASGKRVNKSVFECFLTDGQLEKLRGKIARRVTRYDSVLFYRLCRDCIERIERQGTTGMPVETVKVF